MGFKEGMRLGEKTAEKIYYLSSEFESAQDPRLTVRLKQAGISEEQTKKLQIWPTLNPEDMGWTAGAIKFFFKHGLRIWNPQNRRPGS